MAGVADALRQQWRNPGDILSLLLLVGGDIVQKAIVQLVGYKLRLPGIHGHSLAIAPVAFSFGWVAYGFSILLSAIGDRTLMPAAEFPSILVNCSNAFTRENQSWILGRLLRDHEINFEVDPRPLEEGGRSESLRIDIFNLGIPSTVDVDFVWWLGWMTIAGQIGIAIAPWVLYDDWGVMMIVLAGNLLSAITCALPQWEKEKWPGRKLEGDKVTCLTRGNGSLHIMVFIGHEGSWNLETLATGVSVRRSETRWISLALATLWTCLLISVSGLREHTWFLVLIGGIGMLQNVYAAGKARKPSASSIDITRFSRASTIIGKREKYEDDPDVNINLEEDLKTLDDLSRWIGQRPTGGGAIHGDPAGLESGTMPRWLASMSKEDGTPEWLQSATLDYAGANMDEGIIYAPNVHGALMELEKWVPTAGLAMVQVFFPAGLKYGDESIRDNVHKKFWQRAYYTRDVRKAAEEKRRKAERAQGLEDHGGLDGSRNSCRV
ncbi:hypothetical protein LTR96_011448 [Exophiala xenobiotica]|nr:hypothetical protein LTR96_011448 [Exophiala xenobiotica]KAK5284210.1 hypothetical protein LTR14_011745 [Exophiala xenobiotica]